MKEKSKWPIKWAIKVNSEFGNAETTNNKATAKRRIKGTHLIPQRE